jgi:hypothetical protein
MDTTLLRVHIVTASMKQLTQLVYKSRVTGIKFGELKFRQKSRILFGDYVEIVSHLELALLKKASIVPIFALSVKMSRKIIYIYSSCATTQRKFGKVSEGGILCKPICSIIILQTLSSPCYKLSIHIKCHSS